MKKLKLIYNPFSGNTNFKYELDECVSIFQEGGYDVHLFRITNIGDVDSHIKKMDKDYDVVVVAGGDGTVNLVINSLMKRNLSIPLGIIPSGTANDFAKHLDLKSNDVYTSCKVIVETTPILVDIGIANDMYFINVCGGGELCNVSQHINTTFKNVFGNLAYYLRALEHIAFINPITLEITNSTDVYVENVFLFLILNSTGAGSFDKLAPAASVSDGSFDFVFFKSKPRRELAMMFLKALTGDHLNDDNILFFKDSYAKIRPVGDTHTPALEQINLDGEKGPTLPIEVKLIHNAIPIFANSLGNNYVQ